MAPIIAISHPLARGRSSLHPIFKEHRRNSFNYPEKFLPDFSNLKANCGRWANREKVIYRYLDCGDPHNGFARVKCRFQTVIVA